MVAQNMRYTDHAEGRVTGRDIPQSAIMAVIMSGEVEVEPGGVKRYTLEGFVVVVNGCNVVTAYYDSDLRHRGDWSPKKKQRKRQEKRRRFNPQYIEGRGHINVRQQELYQRQMEGRR